MDAANPPRDDRRKDATGRAARPVSRRTVLGGGLAAGALAASTLLPKTPFAQGVAPPAGAPASGATPTGATPIAGAPGNGILVSSVEGVPNAYTTMPAPFASTQGVPGSGGKVTMSTTSYSPPPTAHDQNTFWQALEQRLGVQWDADLIPASSYGEKMTALMAGGDLPELMFLLQTTTAPIIGQALNQGAFTDLTDLVESGGLSDYPNIAQLPDLLWQNVRINGKIYGVPKPVLRSNDIAFYRADWAEAVGIPNPKTTEDYFNLFVAMAKNDPDKNGQPDTWALAGFNGGWNMFLFEQMFRCPYGWRLNADGTLTNQIETDEYRQALDFATRLYAAGAYHPDTAGMTLDVELNNFRGGKIGLFNGGFATFYGAGGQIETIAKGGGRLVPLLPVGPDGKPGVTFAGQGFFGMVGIPANVGSDGDKLKELLRIIDYLVAPFGSEESNFARYGLTEDHDVAADGSFVKNDRGRADMSALVYPFLSENSFFYPGFPNDAAAAQKLNEQMAQIAVTNPAAGIVSETATQQGAVLSQLGIDRVTAIITGRASPDSLADYINEWKNRGGDQIRHELQEGIAANKSSS